MTPAEFELGLAQFSGSENLWRDSFFNHLVYTDGFKWAKDAAGLHWLLGEIWGAWLETPEVRDDELTFWTLKVNPDKSAVLEGSHDSAGPVYWRKEIAFTDFPLPEFQLYLAAGDQGPVLMLPGEY